MGGELLSHSFFFFDSLYYRGSYLPDPYGTTYVRTYEQTYVRNATYSRADYIRLFLLIDFFKNTIIFLTRRM